MARLALVDDCFDAADGNPLRALAWAITATRWRMIAEGRIDPQPDEPVPVEVRVARREHDARLAAV